MPNLINEQEFKMLNLQLKNQAIDCSFEYHDPSKRDIKVFIKNLVENCYRLDENEVPKKYRMLNIDEILPDYKTVRDLSILIRISTFEIFILRNLNIKMCG